MYILAGLIIWMIVGLVWLRHFSNTTLPMMSDDRSNPRPWLAYPALILVVLLWPIGNEVSWWCFHIVRMLPSPKKKQSKKPIISLPAQGDDPIHEWVCDYDVNSLYAGTHPYGVKPTLVDNPLRGNSIPGTAPVSTSVDEEYAKSICSKPTKGHTTSPIRIDDFAYMNNPEFPGYISNKPNNNPEFVATSKFIDETEKSHNDGESSLRRLYRDPNTPISQKSDRDVVWINYIPPENNLDTPSE